MKCEECGGKTAVERNAVHRYDSGGVSHVELHGVEVTRCRTCGKESIAIPRIAQLHRVIAHGFVEHKRMLAPIEIRFLRKHMGLSGSDFARRMGVSRETVSRWESGAQPVGAVADRLLRLLVATHEPTQNYAVEDLLRDLTDVPAPSRLSPMTVRNNRLKGWLTTGERRVTSA